MGTVNDGRPEALQTESPLARRSTTSASTKAGSKPSADSFSGPAAKGRSSVSSVKPSTNSGTRLPRASTLLSTVSSRWGTPSPAQHPSRLMFRVRLGSPAPSSEPCFGLYPDARGIHDRCPHRRISAESHLLQEAGPAATSRVTSGAPVEARV